MYNCRLQYKFKTENQMFHKSSKCYTPNYMSAHATSTISLDKKKKFQMKYNLASDFGIFCLLFLADFFT